MDRWEASNVNFIIFGSTQPRLELRIYRTLGEHANHNSTRVVGLDKNTHHNFKPWE
jgi:hypothetical protein